MIERLKLELEELGRQREAETLERSESRTQVFEEREEREREAIEDSLNAVRDQLVATTIELQREDELDIRAREIEEMAVEHRRQLEAVDDVWRGDVKSTELEPMDFVMYVLLRACGTNPTFHRYCNC